MKAPLASSESGLVLSVVLIFFAVSYNQASQDLYGHPGSRKARQSLHGHGSGIGNAQPAQRGTLKCF
jgi:hypothetical protein